MSDRDLFASYADGDSPFVVQNRQARPARLDTDLIARHERNLARGNSAYGAPMTEMARGMVTGQPCYQLRGELNTSDAGYGTPGGSPAPLIASSLNGIGEAGMTSHQLNRLIKFAGFVGANGVQTNENPTRQTGPGVALVTGGHMTIRLNGPFDAPPGSLLMWTAPPTIVEKGALAEQFDRTIGHGVISLWLIPYDRTKSILKAADFVQISEETGGFHAVHEGRRKLESGDEGLRPAADQEGAEMVFRGFWLMFASVAFQLGLVVGRKATEGFDGVLEAAGLSRGIDTPSARDCERQHELHKLCFLPSKQGPLAPSGVAAALPTGKLDKLIRAARRDGMDMFLDGATYYKRDAEDRIIGTVTGGGRAGKLVDVTVKTV